MQSNLQALLNQTTVMLGDFYTKTDVDAKFALKDDIPDGGGSISTNWNGITFNTDQSTMFNVAGNGPTSSLWMFVASPITGPPVLCVITHGNESTDTDVISSYFGAGRIDVYKNNDFVNNVPLIVPKLQTDELKNSAGDEYITKPTNEKFDSIGSGSSGNDLSLYPVGSMIDLHYTLNPQTIYGGTWEFCGIKFYDKCSLMWKDEQGLTYTAFSSYLDFNGYNGTLTITMRSSVVGSHKKLIIDLSKYKIKFDNFSEGIELQTYRTKSFDDINLESCTNNELVITIGNNKNIDSDIYNHIVLTLASFTSLTAFENRTDYNCRFNRTA